MENNEIVDYYMNDIVQDVLYNTLPKEKLNRIMDVINVFNAMNNLPNLEVEFNLEGLEEDLENVIYENEDDSNDVVGDIILVTINNFILDNISKLGIILNEDSRLSEQLDILSAMYTIYTLDDNVIQDIINILNDDTRDDIEVMIDVIDDYTLMGTTKLYDAIEDVDNFAIENLRSYLEYRLFLKNDDIEEEIKNKIEYLISIDPMFCSTSIVSKYLKGEEYNNLGEAKVALYKVLDGLERNINLVPYEIAAALYMLNDEKEELTNLYNEEIDLVIISWIGNEQNKHTIVNNLVMEVLNKLKLRS